MKTIQQIETEAILAMGEMIKHQDEEIKILKEIIAKYEQDCANQEPTSDEISDEEVNPIYTMIR